MHVVVCTVVHHPADARIYFRQIRALLDAGHQVTYVQNATDVDDPLLERAARDGEDWRELATREIARYRADMEALRILPPDRLIGAGEALPVSAARLKRPRRSINMTVACGTILIVLAVTTSSAIKRNIRKNSINTYGIRPPLKVREASGSKSLERLNRTTGIRE